MSSITLKTVKRATSVSRSKIRKAVSAAYAEEPVQTVKPAPVVRVTKKTSPKNIPAKAS